MILLFMRLELILNKGVSNYLVTSSAFLPDLGACRQASHLLCSTTVSSTGVQPPRGTGVSRVQSEGTGEACMVNVKLF